MSNSGSTAKRTTTQRGLGWRHQQAAAGLLRAHHDGAPCEWCGRPMWRERTRNWDYNPQSSPNSGKLHADHRGISRAEALRRAIPIALPDRLLHGACNIQRGSGGNDHLAAVNAGADHSRSAGELGIRAMDWPW